MTSFSNMQLYRYHHYWTHLPDLLLLSLLQENQPPCCRPSRQVKLNPTVRHWTHAATSVNIVPPPRAGTLQVFFNNNTQDSGSHMSQMSDPLFTEDRYSTSSGSDQEVCDQEVRNITRTHTPSETSTVVMSPRPESGATVDYSTQGDPDQPAYSSLSDLAHDQQFILSTCNYLLPNGSRRRIYDIPAPQHQLFMNKLLL